MQNIFCFLLIFFNYFVIYMCNEYALEIKIQEAKCINYCRKLTNHSSDSCPCPGLNKITTKGLLKPLKIFTNLSLLCKQENMLVLSWNQTGNNNDSIYFLDYKYMNNTTSLYTDIRKNNNSFLSIKNLNPDTEYFVRLWEITKNNTIFKTDYRKFKTNSRYINPMPIEDIYVKEMIMKDYKYNAIINWIPAKDLSCFYDFIWYGQKDEADYRQIEVRDPALLYEITIPDLEFDDEYSVIVIAKSSDWQRESTKSWLNITTASCLESHFDLAICPPEKPENLKTNIVRTNDRSSKLYNVKVIWTKPYFKPDYYLVHFISPTAINEKEKRLNVTGDTTNATFINVDIGVMYQITLIAWSQGGSSEPAMLWKYSTDGINNDDEDDDDDDEDSNNSKEMLNFIEIIIITFSTFIILFVFIILFICWNKCKSNHHTYNYHRNFFNNIQLKLKLDPLNNLQLFSDKWEIDPNRLKIDKLLGEGAFGLVQKAHLETTNDKIVDVAIKVLKHSPTIDEIREFYNEIDIMKSVGAHPNLVSIIGCITKQPTEPMLIIEYCSKGDLQNYLRTVSIDLSNRGIPFIDMTFIDIYDKSVSNKLYDSLCKETKILETKDLLSFARQIAIGMEYLSKLKVVHRDLAARNVLLCNNNIVKISDFGLSRDIYLQNVYCKSSSGKLPMRWMALESLTHQLYTSQSDVWSFGILLWEIVTLGGNPYPEVSNQELLGMLKQGYRMECPSNCSVKLYEIMCKCWKAVPKDRPFFTELIVFFDELLENLGEFYPLTPSDKKEIPNEFINNYIV